MIVNAENLILGRLATFVAKQALLGEKVEIINCERAVVSGSKENVLAHYKWKREVGDTFKGPFFSRGPDRIVKRTVRGMLPYKKDRGRKAFSKVRCYIGIPESLKDKNYISVSNANIKRWSQNYITVGEISKYLGAKV